MNTLVVSAHASHTGSAATNGVGYTSNYDYATNGWTGLHDGSGGPACAVSGTKNGSATKCTVTQGGYNLAATDFACQITSTGAMANAKAGMIIPVTFASVYTAGYFEIIRKNDDNSFDIELNYSSDTTCDCVVGGFVAHPETLISAGVISGETTINGVGPATYTLTGNMTFPNGTSFYGCKFLPVDVDGAEILPLDRVGTSKLVMTNMPVFAGGSYSVIFGTDWLVAGLLVTGNTGPNPFDTGTRCLLYRCAGEASGISNYGIKASTNCLVIDCDGTCSNTSEVTYGIFGSSYTLICGCIGEVASESGYGIASSYCPVIDSISIGPSSGTGSIGIRSYPKYGLAGMINCSVYGFDTAMQILSQLTGNYPSIVINSIIEDCNKFAVTSDSYAVRVTTFNSVINGITEANMYDLYTGSVTYEAANNTLIETFATSEFTNAATGDFTLVSGANAIDAGLFGNDCGAIQSSGGGAIVNQGLHAIESGITA